MTKLELRALSDADLFTELQSLKLPLDTDTFYQLAQGFDSPEGLAQELTQNWQSEHAEKIYLYLFELWRRLLPDKPSLSIFCTELDLKIKSGQHDLTDDWVTLLNILQTSVDDGVDPKEAFAALQFYFETDLENCLYDTILAQIQNSNASYAKELIEEFIPYFTDPLWFDYLHALALSQIEPDEGFLELEKVVEICCKKQDLELNFEILTYLAKNGHSLFMALADKMVGLIKEQEDMEDFLKIVASHFATIEHNQKLEVVQKLIEKNRNLGPTKICLDTVFSKQNLALEDF